MKFFRFRTRNTFQQQTSPHVEFLYNMALRYTGNSYDAEDLVQETMFAAYKNFSSLRDESKCKSWLLTILRRLFYKEYEKQNNRPVLLDDAAYIKLLDKYSGTIDDLAFESLDTVAEVQKILDELPEKHKTPLLLFYMEDMSYKEIAGTLNLPIGTVMSRLSRAKHCFKKAMLAQMLSQKQGSNIVPIHSAKKQADKKMDKEVG